MLIAVAVEKALAPIEALAAQKGAEAIGPNPFLLVVDLHNALATARATVQE